MESDNDQSISVHVNTLSRYLSISVLFGLTEPQNLTWTRTIDTHIRDLGGVYSWVVTLKYP